MLNTETLGLLCESCWDLVNNPNIDPNLKKQLFKKAFIEACGLGYESALKELGQYSRRSPAYDVLRSELDIMKGQI